MVRAIPHGWSALIGRCWSIFLGEFHWSLTAQSGIMDSTLYIHNGHIHPGLSMLHTTDHCQTIPVVTFGTFI